MESGHDPVVLLPPRPTGKLPSGDPGSMVPMKRNAPATPREVERPGLEHVVASCGRGRPGSAGLLRMDHDAALADRRGHVRGLALAAFVVVDDFAGRDP